MLTRTLILVVAVLLTGCSSFKLGAMCYLPAGMAGSCSVVPVMGAPGEQS